MAKNDDKSKTASPGSKPARDARPVPSDAQAPSRPAADAAPALEDASMDAAFEPAPHPSNGATEPADPLRAKLAEYADDLQRLAAEFDNYKKRVEREKSEARLRGRAEAILPFLGMQEVFEQALAQSDGQNPDARATHEGLVLLRKQLQSILQSSGVQEIPCVGQPNHAYHEVMLQVPGEPAGEIAQVLRKGYRMDHQVLRAAQVSVYAGEEKKEDEQNEAQKRTDGTSPS